MSLYTAKLEKAGLLDCQMQVDEVAIFRCLESDLEESEPHSGEKDDEENSEEDNLVTDDSSLDTMDEVEEEGED